MKNSTNEYHINTVIKCDFLAGYCKDLTSTSPLPFYCTCSFANVAKIATDWWYSLDHGCFKVVCPHPKWWHNRSPQASSTAALVVDRSFTEQWQKQAATRRRRQTNPSCGGGPKLGMGKPLPLHTAIT